MNLKKFLKADGQLVGVDVDTQSDFVDEYGTLYVKVSQHVRPNIAKLFSSFKLKVASVDSHGPDAWEFQANQGPFREHCLKGTPGWLKIPETRSPKMRFIPMSKVGQLEIGANQAGGVNRNYGPQECIREVLDQQTIPVFEKEVYSMFANPNTAPFLEELVRQLGGRKRVLFLVFGYCTGGYCVDESAIGLHQQNYQTAIIEDACGPLKTGEQAAEEITRTMAKENEVVLLNTEEVLEALAMIRN